MKVNDDWKFRKNDVSNLTVAQLIENTISEEMKEELRIMKTCRCEGQDQDFHYKEAYYRAIAILNELL